ncbi:MAG: acetoacetate--CoA ligase [Desulfotomaculales bacterium]
MTAAGEGTLLWEPSEEFKKQANITRYMTWLAENKGLRFADYHDLWSWSVTDLEGFWASIWDFFRIKASRSYTRVLAERKMPGARWFEGAELNYAEHVFRNVTPAYPALIFQSEARPRTELSWEELHRRVSAVAAALRRMGVRRGDRVVAYVANIPEAVIAFLACASIGAVWSSCSPDFGSRSVIDRFRQIGPKVLFAVDGYRYGGKPFDRRPVVAELQRALPTLERTVLIPYLFPEEVAARPPGTVLWDDLLAEKGGLTFEQVPFDHPLWVLYSSGTTGLPKAIVQGHGGILVEHLKALSLQFDLKPGDRFFWFTTTGWMMWNIVVGGLLVGATIMLYDGNPAYPDLGVLWRFAADTRMTFFGTSAGYLTSCMKAGLEPGKTCDLAALKAIGSTGSPLPPEGFQWVYEKVKRDLWLSSASGGTDVCTGFVGGCPLLPVHAGELQCRSLGVKAEAFDEEGRSLVDRVGELVITEPMPSMPLFFWNDPDNRRYLESYFDMYPGVWRHGDWIKITSRGSAVIYGRSDSTLNRMGVRMGSSEIYSAVEDLPEVQDSLVVGVELPGGGYFMPLFVVLREGVTLDEDLKAKIKEKIRTTLTPRHVPDEIFAVPEVPRTLNMKKLEVPVKKILMGVPVEKAVNVDSMSNPGAMEYYAALAARLKLPVGS